LSRTYSIIPLNESAALVSFGNIIDESVNRLVMALHQRVSIKPFQGFIESVPAYSSLAIFYNPIEIQDKDKHKTAFDFVKEHLEIMLKIDSIHEVSNETEIVELPVLYDGEDLDFISEQHQITNQEIIVIHTSKTYRVFMIGFLPGFPYMGTVEERIATSRKNSPRISVPPGSIGIAGFQTGIYPQSSPGGWQLIGRTPIRIFNKQRTQPCLLRPGDSVRFYSIDKYEFERRNEY
jgi:inhibitor of KinA